jgi:hypothetical protein
MKMTNCIAGIQYLPSVEYFAHWMHHGNIVFEIHEHYQKRTWRNKTSILGPQMALSLTVPLRKGKNHEMLITKVEIAYDEIWTKAHMNSIRTAYGKTAFFNELEDDLVSIFNSTPKYLWELNLQFIQLIISFFPGEWNIEYTHSYESSRPDSIFDLRKGVPAGRTSLMKSSYPLYEQIHHFTNSHLPNLSILDVLCHLGPGSYDYLKHYTAELYR